MSEEQMDERTNPIVFENAVNPKECVDVFVASHGTINTGFTFMGPFSSPEAAVNNGYPHVQWEALTAQSVGFTFLITDGQPGSTIFAAYARELSYEKPRQAALDECAGCWELDDTSSLTVLASFFGDVTLKEIATCP